MPEVIYYALSLLVGYLLGWAIHAPRVGRATDLPKPTRPAPPMPRIRTHPRKVSRKRNQK